VSLGTASRWGILWSRTYQQLIFPYYDYERPRVLVCVQARNFSETAKSKYYNQGSVSRVATIYSCKAKGNRGQEEGIHNNHLALDRSRNSAGTVVDKLPDRDNSRLVITEDCISSIRVSEVCDAMPALGTSVPLHKITHIKSLGYSDVTVWLDSDKWREARDIAEKFKLVGLSANTVLSDLDPKKYTTKQIQEFLK
jgi:hypothetical protein